MANYEVNTMNKCILEKRINHERMKEQFKNTLFFCPLFKKGKAGVNTVGIICGGCCIRIQMVGEKFAESILKKEFSYEDFERNQKVFTDRLTGELREYAEVVGESLGMDWESIRGACNRCNPLPVEPQEVPKVEATKMSNVARRDV